MKDHRMMFVWSTTCLMISAGNIGYSLLVSYVGWNVS